MWNWWRLLFYSLHEMSLQNPSPLPVIFTYQCLCVWFVCASAPQYCCESVSQWIIEFVLSESVHCSSLYSFIYNVSGHMLRVPPQPCCLIDGTALTSISIHEPSVCSSALLLSFAPWALHSSGSGLAFWLLWPHFTAELQKPNSNFIPFIHSSVGASQTNR